jgi:hypothetical protein
MIDVQSAATKRPLCPIWPRDTAPAKAVIKIDRAGLAEASAFRGYDCGGIVPRQSGTRTVAVATDAVEAKSRSGGPYSKTIARAERTTDQSYP